MSPAQCGWGCQDTKGSATNQQWNCDLLLCASLLKWPPAGRCCACFYLGVLHFVPSEDIDAFDWTASFPELNPIKHSWNIVYCCFHGCLWHINYVWIMSLEIKWMKMASLFFFFSEDNKPNGTDQLLKNVGFWMWTHARTGSGVLNICLPPLPFSDAHVAPERTAPKTVKCWHRKQRGRNTPAIGSSGSAESVRSHNVPLYYRGNYISIRIIKNVESRCAAKCTLSSVSLSLNNTSLPLLLVSKTDWRPNSGQNR